MFEQETAESSGTLIGNNHSEGLPKDFLVPRAVGARNESQARSHLDGPRFKKLKTVSTGTSLDQIKTQPLYELFDLHEELMLLFRIGEAFPPRRKEEASLLDLKIEMVRHLLLFCSLCKQLCWINRIRGEIGVCRLGLNPRVIDLSLSGPDKTILEITLAGSGRRCRSCQKERPSGLGKNTGIPLDYHLWPRLDVKEARFLSFNGGNPENSLLAILEFLNTVPENWKIPIVWNGHSHTTPPILSLLEGIVDVYSLDFSFTCAVCGQETSFTSQFPETAQMVRTVAREQNVPLVSEIVNQKPCPTPKEGTAAGPAYS